MTEEKSELTTIIPTQSRHTLDVLPSYTGHNCAFLLFLLGYETIDHISQSKAYDLALIPGIGRKRLAQIERALNDQGLTIDYSRVQFVPTVTQPQALTPSVPSPQRSQRPQCQLVLH